MDNRCETYANESEIVNDGYLQYFNARMRFFNVKRNPKYSIIDYSGRDRKGRKINIESKVRFNQINTYDTIFIEKKKWDALKDDYVNNNIIPLYLNFMQDGHHVFLVNLTQYFTGEKKIDSKFVDIANYGYNRLDQEQLRYLIPIRDGIYFEFDTEKDKYIRRW